MLSIDSNKIDSKVLNYIEGRGPYGSTDDEAEAALGLSHQTVSSARNRLEKDGLVVKAYTETGARAKRKTRSGRKAGVYVSVEFDAAPPRPVIDPDAQALADTLTEVGNQFGIISREMLGDVPGGQCADSAEVLGIIWNEFLGQITKAANAFDQYKAKKEAGQ
tara:strand:+ start:229 stop:717 length:489 start_codon:yes stop_codon:yes gene_type:complete